MKEESHILKEPTLDKFQDDKFISNSLQKHKLKEHKHHKLHKKTETQQKKKHKKAK